MTTRFSASNAGRLMACPASANLDLAIPNWVAPVVDPTKGAKGLGTNIHSVFEKAWELGARDLLMYSRAVAYVAELRQTRRFKTMIETSVTATWLQSQPQTTADLVLYTQDEIHVIDTKTGKIHVDVHDNEQLMFYAVCYAPLAPKAKGVTVHILQPWADNMEAVFISAAELKKFMDEAIAAEAKVLAKDLTFGPSDHCKFCPANPHSRGDKGKPLCPAMMQILYPPIIHEDEILSL